LLKALSDNMTKLVTQVKQGEFHSCVNAYSSGTHLLWSFSHFICIGYEWFLQTCLFQI